MLGDSTRLAGHDIRFADDIQQRGLAVIDVAHDGYHRRAQLQIFRLVLDVQFDFPDGGVNDAAAAFALFNLEAELVFRANFLRNRFVDSLVHVGKDVQFHQIGDQLERLAFELFGQFAHHDGRFKGNDDRRFRQIDFGSSRSGRLGRLNLLRPASPACGRLGSARRETATNVSVVSPATPEVRTSTGKARTRWGKLDGAWTGFVSGPRRGFPGQLNKTDFIADLRAGRRRRRRSE